MKQDRRIRMLGLGVFFLCSVPFAGEFFKIPDFFNGFSKGIGLVFVIAAIVWKAPKGE